MNLAKRDPENPSLTARARAFEAHLVVDRGIAKITARMRSNIVRKCLREWATLNPTRDQVQAEKEKRVLGGYHRGYVANLCRAFYDYGRFIGVDLKVKNPTPQKARSPRFLTEQEVQSFLFAVDSIRDRALFSFLAYSGLRCAELCNLKREDLSFEKKTAMVHMGKGGKSAEVPVAQSALEAVSAFLRATPSADGTPWLFSGPKGERLSTNRVRVLAARYGRKAGLAKRVSPHMFRHALATNLLSNGCPLPFVQRQLRHSKIETTLVYLHLSDKHLRDNYARFLPSYG